MNPSLRELQDAASGLPASERAELARFLLSSLDDQEEEEVRDDWLAMAELRMSEVRAGKVIGVPADEVLRSLLEPRK